MMALFRTKFLKDEVCIHTKARISNVKKEPATIPAILSHLYFLDKV
jgi:hypothetical protein